MTRYGPPLLFVHLVTLLIRRPLLHPAAGHHLKCHQRQQWQQRHHQQQQQKIWGPARASIMQLLLVLVRRNQVACRRGRGNSPRRK